MISKTIGCRGLAYFQTNPSPARRLKKKEESKFTMNSKPEPSFGCFTIAELLPGIGILKTRSICLDCGDRPNFSVPTHSHFVWNQLHPGTTLEICWLGIGHIHFARYTVLICTNIIYQLLLVFPQNTAIGVFKATVTWSNGKAQKTMNAAAKVKVQMAKPDANLGFFNANAVDCGIKYDPHFLPSGNVNVAIENDHRNSGFSHEKW